MSTRFIYSLSLAIGLFMFVVLLFFIVQTTQGRDDIPLSDGLIMTPSTDRGLGSPPAEPLEPANVPSADPDRTRTVDYDALAATYESRPEREIVRTATGFRLSAPVRNGTIRPAPLPIAAEPGSGTSSFAQYETVRIEAEVRLPINREMETNKVTSATLGCYADEGTNRRGGVFLTVGPAPDLGRVDVYVSDGEVYRRREQVVTDLLTAGWHSVILVCDTGEQSLEVWVDDNKLVSFSGGDDPLEWQGPVAPVIGILSNSVEEESVEFREIEIGDLS